MKQIPLGSLVSYSSVYMKSWGANYKSHWVGVVIEHMPRWGEKDPYYKVKWTHGNVESHICRNELKYFRGKK